jgi:hypothetical protein
MKKEKLYEIGKTLGLSKEDVKGAINKNRNKIITCLAIAVASIITISSGYQALHYLAPSIKDFDFFMRFF